MLSKPKDVAAVIIDAATKRAGNDRHWPSLRMNQCRSSNPTKEIQMSKETDLTQQTGKYISHRAHRITGA